MNQTTRQALRFFDDLVESNLAPNHATLGLLAAARARAGDWAKVDEVLRHMGWCGAGRGRHRLDLACCLAAALCFLPGALPSRNADD
jgi:hypothetical protein